jgi:hypothetical protein
MSTQNAVLESEAASTKENFDVKGIVDNLISQSPEVQPHVIEHFENIENQTQKEFEGLTDRFGVAFDKNIHITGRDGRPSLTKLGKLMRKPNAPSAGRPAAQTQKVSGAKSQINLDPQPSSEPAQAQLKPEHKATGIALTGAIMALAVAIGGEEFNPIKREDLGLDERAMLENAAAEWLRAKNMVDLPPDYAFGIALASYFIPRFTMPKTQNRIKLFFQWIGGKFVSWKARRALVK